MRTKVTLQGQRKTKWEIASMIEKLPGNRAWGLYSSYTLYCDKFSLLEVAETYNQIIKDRLLEKPLLEIKEQ